MIAVAGIKRPVINSLKISDEVFVIPNGCEGPQPFSQSVRFEIPHFVRDDKVLLNAAGSSNFILHIYPLDLPGYVSQPEYRT